MRHTFASYIKAAIAALFLAVFLSSAVAADKESNQIRVVKLNRILYETKRVGEFVKVANERVARAKTRIEEINAEAETHLTEREKYNPESKRFIELTQKVERLLFERDVENALPSRIQEEMFSLVLEVFGNLGFVLRDYAGENDIACVIVTFDSEEVTEHLIVAHEKLRYYIESSFGQLARVLASEKAYENWSAGLKAHTQGVRRNIIVLKNIVYADESLDITDEVLALLDRHFETYSDALASDTAVYRDKFGVAHVSGSSERGAAFGFGYAQAEDCMREMAKAYHRACGRMAAHFGEKFLASDRRARLFKFAEIATEEYSGLDREIREYLESFVAGINFYARTHRESLPNWVTEVKVFDVLAFVRMMMLEPAFAVLSGESPRSMTNQLALAPTKSESGRSLFMADQHLPFAGYTRMYEAHVAGGRFDVYGATFIGLPFFLVGHNGRIAWSIAANGADTADLYKETVNADVTDYHDGETWRPVTVEEESFIVAGAGAPVKGLLKYTRHGPIIKEEDGIAYSAKIAGWRDPGAAAQFLHIALAQSVGDFIAALRIRGVPSYDFMCADREGHIYYANNALVPMRKDGVNPSKPLSGTDPASEWEGFVDFDELPQITDPRAGYLGNCNSSPWYVTDEKDVPYSRESVPVNTVPYDIETGRSRRLKELVKERELVSFDLLKEFAVDAKVESSAVRGRELLDLVEGVVPEGELASEVERFIRLVEEWDGMASVDSAGMTAFSEWRRRYDRYCASSEPVEAALKSLQETVATLLADYGGVEVPWGGVHRYAAGAKEYPLAGGTEEFPSLRMASGFRDEEGVMWCNRGSAYTFVVALDGDRTEAASILPYGVSPQGDSPHATDQMKLYSSGRLKKALYDFGDVGDNLERAWGRTIQISAPSRNFAARIEYQARPGTFSYRYFEKQLPFDTDKYVPVSAHYLFLGEEGLDGEVTATLYYEALPDGFFDSDVKFMYMHPDEPGVWREAGDVANAITAATARVPIGSVAGLFVSK